MGWNLWSKGRDMALGLSLAALMACGAQAWAAEAEPASADPVLEAKVLKVSAGLRCLVCQNQTVADSNAPLAVDLRQQVREMLQAGKSEAEIIEYMKARYGDFVLYKPPVQNTTALLWFGPGVLLVGGLILFVLVLRRRSRLSPDRFEPDPPADDDSADASPR